MKNATVKVLIVEDDLLQQKMLVRGFGFVKSCKAKVELVDNGEEALALFKQKDFDLVIMDHGLPGMNGYETAKTMRKIKNVPIIWCSANGDPSKVNADDFDWYAKLGKPTDFDQLEKIIEEFVKS